MPDKALCPRRTARKESHPECRAEVRSRRAGGIYRRRRVTTTRLACIPACRFTRIPGLQYFWRENRCKHRVCSQMGAQSFNVMGLLTSAHNRGESNQRYG